MFRHFWKTTFTLPHRTYRNEIDSSSIHNRRFCLCYVCSARLRSHAVCSVSCHCNRFSLVCKHRPGTYRHGCGTGRDKWTKGSDSVGVIARDLSSGLPKFPASLTKGKTTAFRIDIKHVRLKLRSPALYESVRCTGVFGNTMPLLGLGSYLT